MRFIHRWGLMRNTQSENIMEHSLQVAMIAHALALIKNRWYDGAVDPDKTAALALFHDASEVITGDLATPVKYFNPQIKQAYSSIESVAKQKLLDMLPEGLREDYVALFSPRAEDEECWQMVRAADKICAYLKCVEEAKAGNREFSQAEKSLEAILNGFEGKEVRHFIDEFVPSFSLTLDELN